MSHAVKLRTAQNHLANPIRLLPVREVEELTSKVRELVSLSRKADEVLNRLKDDYYSRRSAGGLEDAERDLKELGELPSDMASTLGLFDRGMLTATTEQIADGLTVLHGLFASQGDPQIVATTGVEIIEAEHASAVAYRTVLTMLRPPGKIFNPEEEEWERPPARRFLPTMPEIIAELRDTQELWEERRKRVRGLSKRHDQARHKLIMHLDDLRRGQAETNASLPEEEEDWPF